MINYKCMILSAFLLPFAVNSYGKSAEVCIKELQETQFKKELEISDLSDLIAQRYASLAHYRSNALIFWTTIQEKKIEILQKKNALSKEECIKAQSEIEILFDQFIKDFGAAFNATKDIKQLVERVSFDQESFETLRIALLRVVLEQRLIDKFTLKYEALIQALIKIDQELANLRK